MAPKTISRMKIVLILAPLCLHNVQSTDKIVNHRTKPLHEHRAKEDSRYWKRNLNTFVSIDSRMGSDSIPPVVSQTTARSIETFPPSAAPECKVDVKIDCIAENGINCDQLEPPSAQCSYGSRISSLSFKLVDSDCSGSKNSQKEKFVCEDSDLQVRSYVGKLVDVFCSDTAGQVFFAEKATIGDSIDLKNHSYGLLPDSITCKVANEQQHEIQKVTLNTSGNVDLFLKNTFGVFELEACHVENRSFQRCNMPVEYKYTLVNSGNTEMEVSKLERSRNGNSKFIVSEVQQTMLYPSQNPPGDSTPVLEYDTVDLCAKQQYRTTVVVESETKPRGIPCFDLSQYLFGFKGFGFADVQISCESDDGIDCQELLQKTEDCLTRINYDVDVHNYGSTALSITEVEILQNGHRLNLETFVQPANIVQPGQTVSMDYPDHLNLCISGQYETTALVKANSAAGEVAENMETYFIDNSFTPAPSQLPTTTPTMEQSSLPTSTPSSTPSEAPTMESSANPSLALSGIPTAEPSVIPTGKPSTNPTANPSSSPSLVLSRTPTADPSAKPTGEPSVNPTDQPSPPPTPEMSFGPSTAVPSSQPSSHPSTNPTLSPSAVPSPAPSSTPTLQCQIGFTIDCSAPNDISPDGSCSFDDTQPPGCGQKPSQMTLRYLRGDCSSSFNVQGSTFFSCEDFHGGPPNQTGTSSYIRVTDFGGSGKTYHDGLVNMGDDFVITGEFSANLNITVYDPKSLTNVDDIIKAENIIETVVFHISCPASSVNLFLKDRFGAIQLVGFQNEDQGTVTVFQNLTLSFEASSEKAVQLQTMDIVANIENGHFGIYNVSELVAGKVISSGNPFTGIQNVTIDLGRRTKYTAEGVVVGRGIGGHICYGSHGTDFEAGARIPFLPTTAPTPIPTTSAFPSMDPETAICDLDATISCKRLDGESCNFLKSPSYHTCVGGNAQELSFIYLPSSLCSGINGQARFSCEDYNPDTIRNFFAYIIVRRGTDIFFEGDVSSGQIFSVSIPAFTNEIEISISTVSAFGTAGDLLQRSELSVTCRQEDDLTLLNTFGHLQLVGFKNPEMKSQQVFTEMELTYKVVNDDRHIDAFLTYALTDSPFTGIGDEVLGSNDSERAMGPGDSESFSEFVKLNLASAVGKRFDVFFEVKGEGAFSGKPCRDIAELSLQVD